LNGLAVHCDCGLARLVACAGWMLMCRVVQVRVWNQTFEGHRGRRLL
jgi:hypothetical protein